MLYVLLVSGMLTFQDGIRDESACLMAAAELRKNPKVSDAFCVITNEDQSKYMIGRNPGDGQASN